MLISDLIPHSLSQGFEQQTACLQFGLDEVSFYKLYHDHINQEHGRQNQKGQLSQDSCSQTVKRKSQNQTSLWKYTEVQVCKPGAKKEIEEGTNREKWPKRYSNPEPFAGQ